MPNITDCPLCLRSHTHGGITCRKCWHALPDRLASLLAHTAWVRKTDHVPYLNALTEARNWIDLNRKEQP